jgi:hypothetical protein
VRERTRSSCARTRTLREVEAAPRAGRKRRGLENQLRQALKIEAIGTLAAA